MQILRFALRNLWRDLKSGELSVLLLALCVAVLSLTAVGFFTSRIAQGVRAQAAEVLAADLRLESPYPIAARYFDKSRTLGLKSAQVRVVSDRDLQRRGEPIGGAQCGDGGLSAARARADRRHAVRRRSRHRAHSRPGRSVGRRAHHRAIEDSAWGRDLRIGAATFRVTEVLDYRPDQGTGFVNLAPAVLLNYQDLAATQLIQPGSRATYAALFAGDAAAVAQFHDYVIATKGAERTLARGR